MSDKNFPAKETLYKTCKHEGQYAAILNWYADGDSFMYRIRRLDGTRHIVHISEVSELCL